LKKHTAVIAGLLLCSITYAADKPKTESFPGNDFPEELLEDEFDSDMFFDESDLLVSATGYSKPSRLAPSVATIITAAEIKEMGATTIFEALESVPGLHVYPTFNLVQPAFSMRGIHQSNGSEVLLLRNGLPVKDPLNSNNPGAYRAPITNVARIEVIRGPGSAVHGADAFAGVINIITKDAHEIDGINVGARKGTFNTNSAWVQYGEKYAEWDVAFNLEYTRTSGDEDRMVDVDVLSPAPASHAPDHLQTQHEYYETSLYLRNDNWDIDFWHWQQRNGGNGPGVNHILDKNGNEDHQYYQLDVSYTFRDLLPDWEIKPDVNYVYQDMQRNFYILPPNTFGDPNGWRGNPGSESRTYNASITGTYTGFNDHILRLEVGYGRLEVDTLQTRDFGLPAPYVPGVLYDIGDTPLAYLPDRDRERHFYSFQDEWRLSKEWILTAGLRYDDYSDFGYTYNPRVALVWSPPMPLTAKLLYGQAFRAPTLSEAYIQNNPVIQGNPDLDPQTIDTYELAFEFFPLLELNSRLSLFYYDMDDSIEIVTIVPLPVAPNPTTQYDNTDGQRAYGFEFEVEWEATNNLKLRSNFAWQHAERKDNGSRPGKSPGRQFHFGANWKFMPLWAINTQVNWVGGIKRPKSDPRTSKIGNFTFVDLTLRKQTQDRSWEFAASVKNLFDKQAFEWSSTPSPGDYELQGRSAYAEVSYHFR